MKSEKPGPSPSKPENDPKEKGNDGPTKPGKPGSDPDQTPTREIQDPPVADPNKIQDPGKQPQPGYK